MSYSVTDTEKFNVLKATYPDKYLHYRIFAHFLNLGKLACQDRDESLLINIIKKFRDEKVTQDMLYTYLKDIGYTKEDNLDIVIRDILGKHFEELIDETIRTYISTVARDAKLGKTKKNDDKLILSNMTSKGLDTLENALSSMMKEQGVQYINSFKEVFSTSSKLLVKLVNESGTKTVNNWEHKKNRNTDKIELTRKSIAQESIRTKISDIFGFENDIWGKAYPTIQAFTNDLQEYKKGNAISRILDDYKKSDKENSINIFSWESEIEALNTEEENELVFIEQENPIKIPQDIEKYSPRFMFILANYLKENKQIGDSLDIINLILSRREPYRYRYKNNILLFKAILLSHDNIKKWSEAIDILLDLYSDNYQAIDKEVVTLLASNYKRETLYRKDGSLKDIEKDNIDLSILAKAGSIYREEYELKEKFQRYYDGINLAYVESILYALEDKDNESKTLDTLKREIKTIHKEVTALWQPNRKEWWEMITNIEFYILQGDDNRALSEYELLEVKPSKFQISTTIRQLEMYVHFTKDQLAKDFLDFLKEEENTLN